MRRPLTVLGGAFALALITAGCAAGTGPVVSNEPSPAPAVTGRETIGSATRTNDAGEVTVAVTWVGIEAVTTFEIVLDTHSVDLDGLDLSSSTLRNDRGDQLSAMPWPAPAGGHHRSGPLRFEGDSSRFFADAEWIELVLHGISDVPDRIFRWEV